jgi:Lysozyme like domain
MGALTLDQLRELARRTGFSNPSLAAAVAMAESAGDPNAMHIVTDPGPGALPEQSIGLWQINVLAWPAFDATRLRDPTYNAQAAKLISESPRGWNHWSKYTSGEYLAYMGGQT